jgi:hypothetical protein
MGGLAAIDTPLGKPFGWWPIKAYRTCPTCAASGKKIARKGQTLCAAAAAAAAAAANAAAAAAAAAANAAANAAAAPSIERARAPQGRDRLQEEPAGWLLWR